MKSPLKNTEPLKKKKSSMYKKGFKESFDNPNRISEDWKNITKRVNDLLIKGELSITTSDYFNGLKDGLIKKGYLK